MTLIFQYVSVLFKLSLLNKIISIIVLGNLRQFFERGVRRFVWFLKDNLTPVVIVLLTPVPVYSTVCPIKYRIKCEKMWHDNSRLSSTLYSAVVIAQW